MFILSLNIVSSLIIVFAHPYYVFTILTKEKANVAWSVLYFVSINTEDELWRWAESQVVGSVMNFQHNFHLYYFSVDSEDSLERTAKSWVNAHFIFSSLSFAQQNPKC